MPDFALDSTVRHVVFPWYLNCNAEVILPDLFSFRALPFGGGILTHPSSASNRPISDACDRICRDSAGLQSAVGLWPTAEFVNVYVVDQYPNPFESNRSELRVHTTLESVTQLPYPMVVCLVPRKKRKFSFEQFMVSSDSLGLQFNPITTAVQELGIASWFSNPERNLLFFELVSKQSHSLQMIYARLVYLTEHSFTNKVMDSVHLLADFQPECRFRSRWTSNR